MSYFLETCGSSTAVFVAIENPIQIATHSWEQSILQGAKLV
jgi:hypothetical protein